MARTRREHEVLSRSAGPGVVGVLQLQVSGPTALLVLESVPGTPLDVLLASRRLAAAELLEIALQLAVALERVHDARWIHRDVQPCNVIVEPRVRRTTIVEFDLALPFGTGGGDSAATHGESWRGNLLYSAPEQMGRMNRGVDFRSDLYSLGATLYHASTGHPPFAGEDALGLITRTWRACRSRPSSAAPTSRRRFRGSS